MVNYQVFISFRGLDTRDSLVQYLYDQLTRLGIVAFLDSEEIEYGKPINDKIVEAIKRSDICIPVFSQDFASSPACLMEVAQMVELHKEIHPIFFFVEPCDVRHQLGTYKKSFDKHESEERIDRYGESTIKKWKDALKKISYIRGPLFKKADLKAALEAALGKIGGREGSESIEAALEAFLGEIGGIKGRFSKELFSGFRELEVFISKLWKFSRMDEQDVTRNLVGIDRDVPKMMQKLGFDYEDGRVVKKLEMTESMVFVVWGMPRVGKTTLANVVFHKISHLFKGCSFLENVREEFEQKREVFLQNKLIRELKGGGACPEVKSSTDGTNMIKHMFKNDRVLIVLDDVDDGENFKQIKTLAEELTWFGPGSRIILTTRKKDVIEFYKNGEVFHEHEVSHMNEDHALKLFYKHAFRLDCCLDGYENRSKAITSAVEYLPFAIEMVGRYLYGKSEEDWTETLNRLKSRPEENVEPILMKHFKRLGDDAQEIFLDIACFFTGFEKRIPHYMWDARGWNPRRNVGHLENMSFLRIGEENAFSMHNQLKKLGREIVKTEAKDPSQRSRLWDYKDVQRALGEEKGTNKVEALRVARDFEKVDGKVFHDLSNLRFLELDNVDIEGNTMDLPPDLVWLDWRGCREKSKLFAFKMENLVILQLRSSPVQLTLQEWNQLMKKAGSLEVLNLKDCDGINASLEFPDSSLLKCLILEGCLHLKPNETNSNFENLVSFNIKHCQWVKHLPRALCSMKALKELLIDGTKIGKLQFEDGSLPALEILSACECNALREVTDSIRFLKSLRKLTLRRCNGLNTLPHVFGELVLLQEMDLSYTSIDELPPCVKHCKELQVLKMVRTSLKGFPEAIKDLKELKELDFTLCRGLRGQICDITGLFSLRILKLEGTGISEVLTRDEGRFCFHILELDDVTKLTQTSQKKRSVSELKRKWQTQTSQKNSCVSKHKRIRDEE